MEDKVIVAVYTRVSKDDGNDDASSSIENQIKNIIDYCKEKKYEIYKIYSDDGFSGKDFNRPDFIKLQKDLYAKRFNTIIIKDLSRLGRNLVKVGEFVDEVCPLYKIRIISLLDNYDSSNYENEESIVLRSFLNDYYLKECRKKSIKAIERTYNKKPMVVHGCYGYDVIDRQLVINPEEAEVIRTIFHKYTSGIKTSDIVRWLKENKIYGVGYLRSLKTNCKLNNPDPYFWDSRAIGRIIRDKTYIGVYVNGRDAKHFDLVEIPNSNEPIVDEKTFYKAQLICDKNAKKTRTPTPYTRFVYNADTQKPMVYKAEESTRYHNFPARLRSKGLGINIEVFHEVLKKELDKLFDELTDDKEYLLNKLSKNYKNIKKEIYDLTYENNILESKLKALFESYILGNVEGKSYKQTTAKIQNDLERNKERIQLLNIELKTLNINGKYDELIEEFLKNRNNLSDIDLAKLIFKRVLISKKNNKFVFKFEYNV